MTDNRQQENVQGVDDKSIEQARERLMKRKKELNSYHTLAEELGVNVSYVYEFLEYKKIPSNKQVRQAMGIKIVSRGARIYRALNEKAQAAGWGSWSEYRLAVMNGEVPLTSKGVAAYYKPTTFDNLSSVHAYDPKQGPGEKMGGL